MSKKVVWIWSTNANQGTRGFATTFGMLVRPYKFTKRSSRSFSTRVGS